MEGLFLCFLMSLDCFVIFMGVCVEVDGFEGVVVFFDGVDFIFMVLCVVVIGENGFGKFMLVCVIVGLVDVVVGEVIVYGVDVVWDVKVLCCIVGFVFVNLVV